MKRFVLGLMLLLPMFLMAQNQITGKVQDAATRQVIDFVNVALMQSDKLVKGTVSDMEGKFEIKDIENGKYTLVFSFLGYKELQKTITLSGKPLNIGKVLLEEDTQQLAEVEVVGQGSQMRFELDRKVFSVDQSIASAGGSVSDVLENIPSVEVDQEGNISLRQNEAVEIWINGKPAGLTTDNRADVLRQLPAESIQEIEVITNPSAKFSPEGTAGIINIVMKKDRKAGYYGSVNAGIQYCLASPWNVPPGGNVGFNINFSKSIVDVYFNAGYNYRNSNGSTLTDNKNIDLQTGDTITRLNQEANNNRGGGGLFLRGGIDIRLTDRSTLGFSGFGIVADKSHSKSNNRYLLTDYQNSDTIRLYDRNESGTGGHPGGNAMVTYQFKQQNHSLNLSGAYNQFGWNQYNTYTQIETDTTRQKQDNENLDRMVQLKADYEWKPTKQSRLEAGWQTDLSWRATDANAADIIGDKEQFLQPYYNDFLNKEQIHALYITYGNKFWEKFSVQVGLRGEYMKRHLSSTYYDVEGNLTTTLQDTSYFQLFPSAYLSYSFPNGHELQLNYTRRVDRPRGHQINPRQNFSDSTNIQFGNPNLLPAYSSSLELNYLKQWERHTLSAGLFYRFADGVIQNVRFMDGNVMKNTFVNVSKRQEMGVEIVAKNRFFDNFLQLTTSANLYYNMLSADEYHGMSYADKVDVVLPAQNTLAWSARINAQFLFTKTFSGQLTGRYNSPRVVAQGKTSHSYTIDIGLRKTFFDKKLAISLNVRDLLNSRARQNTTWGDGFWQYQSRRWNSRTIGLTITYNFGNMQSKKTQKTQSDGSSVSSYEDSGEE